MTRERWEHLAPLVDAALDQPPERRVAYVAEISGGDASLAEELTRFVSAYEEQEKNETKAASIFAAANEERSALMSERLRDAAVSLQAQLEASLGASYVVEREIGGGGMARVFVAEEPGLGRKVVIKVLPPEMSEEISAERFAREIKLAASLQQANIVPVLTAGMAAGFPYYTMPFVEGRSLRERLVREGALPVSEAISILRDVARALAFAHGRGVIHRDIKPGNILLSDRTAVVTDFGIAKALGAAREARHAGAMHDSPSNTGTLGTPAYMAPEQASGDPSLDHRADIYSYGCVAFELLTGKPPFAGAATHEVIAAHLRETPQRVTELRSEVPAPVARLVASCLEKDPSRRPQSADDVLRALDGAASQPVALATQRSRRKTLAISTATVVAGVAAALAYYAFRPNEPPAAAGPPMTLTAIPFRNLSRDSTLESSAEGISDEMLTALSKVSGIQIVGRNAGHRYKDGDIDELAVQRELGAMFLITGTYQERDGRITVSAEVNDSITHGELWSGRFEASTDWRWLPDTIARAVASQLQERYAGRVREPKWGAISVAKVSLEAWQAYQGGQSFFKRRKLKESVERFEAALRLEPSYARAHGALALALTLSGVFLDPAPTKLRDSVLNTARRALDLDSTVADAHAAIAMFSQWDSAKTHFRRALELDPDNFEIHLTFGRVATLRGDLPEARDQLEQAKRQDPLSPLVFAWSSYVHFLNGDTALAWKESDRAFLLDSTAAAVTNLGALVYLELGDTLHARRLAGLQHGPLTTAPYVYAKLHDTVTALRIVTRMESANPRPLVADVQRATVMIAIDDTARAFSALERSADLGGSPFRGVIPPCDPAWDRVRRTAHFKELVRRGRQDTLRLTVPGGCRR